MTRTQSFVKSQVFHLFSKSGKRILIELLLTDK